jgi:hypothetical protein
MQTSNQFESLTRVLGLLSAALSTRPDTKTVFFKFESGIIETPTRVPIAVTQLESMLEPYDTCSFAPTMHEEFMHNEIGIVYRRVWTKPIRMRCSEWAKMLYTKKSV